LILLESKERYWIMALTPSSKKTLKKITGVG
jgi:hypothetical protein